MRADEKRGGEYIMLYKGGKGTGGWPSSTGNKSGGGRNNGPKK